MAEADAALALKPGDAEAISLRGLAFAVLGRWAEAEAELLRAVQLEPSEPSFQGNLNQVVDRKLARETQAAMAARDWPLLERIALEWTDRRPGQPAAWRELARAAFETGRHAAAAEAFRRVVVIEGQTPDALATLGGLLLQALSYDEAGQVLDQALLADPDNVQALIGRATLDTYLGRFERAEMLCRHVLRLQPDSAPVYTLLTRLTGGRLSEAERARLESLTSDDARPLDQRIAAAFALAHALDADGKADEAFTAYDRAHAVAVERDRAEGRGYDRAAAADRARRIAALPLEPRLTGPTQPRPIFIVGMARSGTTLVEALLASHPQVFGAGERTALPPIFEAWLARPDSEPGPAWAAAYLQELGDLGGRTWFTDKAPRNLEAVGLISRLFPDAAIVHIRRDPVETCLSLYRQEFARDWAFAHDLSDLGHAYGYSARLADHWARVLPGRMIEVQYETLASDFEAEARRIVEACGLDWDPACAEPAKTQRPIATFSTVSARQPVRVMNTRAEAYAAHLGPLMKALDAEGVDPRTGALRPDAARI